MEAFKMAIGDNIKKYRKINKMTQTELANKLNKSLRTIQKYESNTIKPPTKVIREISDIFFIDMNMRKIEKNQHLIPKCLVLLIKLMKK